MIQFKFKIELFRCPNQDKHIILYSIVKSKTCYNKHDPLSGRNKDRRKAGGGSNGMAVDAAVTYRPFMKPRGKRRQYSSTVILAKKLDNDYKDIRNKERRAQEKVNHRKR